MKQLEVQIMGQSYLLGCPENGDARMLDAVNRVDMAMCRIRDAGKIKARDRIAVLAALNLAFELPERTPNATPTPAATTAETTASAGETTHPQLTALLQRLDTALGVDGRLL
ncbi:cell division protein ZapA [Polaromonas sp. P5_D5]|jgi:cell division protein ZapA